MYTRNWIDLFHKSVEVLKQVAFIGNPVSKSFHQTMDNISEKCDNSDFPKNRAKLISAYHENISENSRKLYVADLANNVHCNFPPEALMNTVSSYEAAYWLDQISYNFLI